MRFTLLTDGSSDKILGRPVAWALRRELPKEPIEIEWANLSLLRRPPQGLAARIRKAMELYPNDVLFVHRDAEGEDPTVRHAEIRTAIDDGIPNGITSHICVVPVRMTESWFLFDESAIRAAAGNPQGNVQLELPPFASVETIPNPKQVLHRLLEAATELPARRLRRFRTAERVYRLAELIEDYAPLDALPAFCQLVTQIKTVLPQLARA